MNNNIHNKVEIIMPNINTPLLQLNKQFYTFSEKAIKPRQNNWGSLIPQLQRYERQYNKLGFAEMFIQNADAFAEKISSLGLIDLAGIIYSHILKNPSLSGENRVKIIEKSLKIAKLQKDNIHILGRIVDLKKIHQANNNKAKYLSSLFEEEFVLQSIIQNYGKNVQKYKTVSRTISPIETYKFRYAACLVDIAKRIMKLESGAAKSRLLKAKQIFCELGRDKEARFAETMLRQLKNK